jgi:hypothetical protein
MVIGSIDHLQVVTTSNCNAIANQHCIHSSKYQTFSVCSVFTSRCLATASTTDAPLTLGSRTISMPQLPASKNNSSQRLNCNSLSHQPTPHCTALYSLTELKSKSLYDWPFTTNQFVLAPSLRAHNHELGRSNHIDSERTT